MTWLAHNWPWILIGYALTSCAAVVGWISLHHIVWALQARRARSISTRASRPVGNQAVTSSASALCTTPGEDAR